MEANKEEALRAVEIAEKRFALRDFAGAKSYALKAKTLYPGLEGISQMVATFEVYTASEVKYNGELDYYSILGLHPSADKDTVKKQYRKMAVLLHPDKNKCVGADGAFKLVSEAWTFLSDVAKRTKQVRSVANQTNVSFYHATGVGGYNNSSNLPTSHSRLDTFWTICTSCKVQYEYLRKYVNKRLSCKNCRGTFIAVETGTAPANGSFPYCPWSYVPGSGYPSHSYDGVAYPPMSASYFNGNGISGYHSGHGYEYAPNVSFQWSSLSGASAGIIGQNVPSPVSADSVYQNNGIIKRGRPKHKSGVNGNHAIVETIVNINPTVLSASAATQEAKSGRPEKKRKVVVSASFRNGHGEKALVSASEARVIDENVNIGHKQKLSNSCEPQIKLFSMAPAFDARKLLIEKARKEIRKKLEEIKLASKDAVKRNNDTQAEFHQSKRESSKRTDENIYCRRPESGDPSPVSITVPDSDFHDFDKDRSEECFKPKQIWALYDEEDGMPRLYCLIREVISVKPFKMHISYLNSKTDSEFGLVNWLDSGFTKSCGNFRAWNSDIVEQVNIFSHALSREKAGRGGCVRIYPRSGDIWAMYRNWSPDWNRYTPDEVRHKYEMVEVLDDYSEELGVCVTPLVKSDGFKTVYQSNTDKAAVRWIPRKEMLRFSHQVPSCLLKGEAINLPEKCWDLDPAATPDELLHATTKANDTL